MCMHICTYCIEIRTSSPENLTGYPYIKIRPNRVPVVTHGLYKIFSHSKTVEKIEIRHEGTYPLPRSPLWRWA